MIPIIEKPENVKVQVSADVEDTTDIILLNLQMALNCMTEAKNLFMECQHRESKMTDLLDDCIKKVETIINTNPEIREDDTENGKNN